jgi:Tol biopolymer transport system component
VSRRLLIVGPLLVLMAGFGLGVYHVLGSFKTDTTKAATNPTESAAIFALPGTLYLSQEGTIYKLQGQKFTAITDNRGWMQPAILADGSLLAVRRDADYSDLFHLDAGGRVIAQLTNDKGKAIEDNHWVFFPRASPSGSSVFYSYDAPKFGFRVDIAIWSSPLGTTTATPRAGNGTTGKQWTQPNEYTGGDVQPVPLAGGGLIYVGYGIDPKEHINATILLASGPQRQSVPLTAIEDDCSAPSLSPDGRTVAMICTHGTQVASLEVASFDGKRLGPLRTVVTGGLVAAPVWAPDGSGLAYLAPAATGGRFQLWWLAGAASAAVPATPSPSAVPRGTTPVPSPSVPATAVPGLAAPLQVTTNLDFDATSAPAWGLTP